MAETFVDLLPVETGFYTDNISGNQVLLNSLAQPTSSAWDMLNDPIGAHDSDTSIVRVGSTPNARWSFKFQRPSLAGATNIGTIVNVGITTTQRRGAPGGGSTIRRFWHTADANNDGTGVGVTTSYLTIGSQYSTNPITGLAWDIQDFENQTIEAGILREDSGGGSVTSITQIYLHIVYNPATWSSQPPPGGTWSASPASGGGWVSIPAGSGGWTVQ